MIQRRLASAFGGAAGVVSVVLAGSVWAQVPVADRWSWSLSTAIGAIGLITVLVAHTTAALVFFFKWNTALQLLRADHESFKAEIRSDLSDIKIELSRLAAQATEIASIRGDVAVIRERLRHLEGSRARTAGRNESGSGEGG